MATLQQAVLAAQQQYQINPVTPFRRGQQVVCKPGVFAYESGIGEVKDIIDSTVIVYFESIQRATICAPRDLELAPVFTERVPLSTRVFLCNGVEALISGHSTCDCNSYRVSWFDHRHWAIVHKWVGRGAFEVLERETPASTEIKTGAL